MLLVLAMLVNQPTGQTAPVTEVQNYMSCIAVVAGYLETSGEPATTIVEVAISNCDKHIVKASQEAFEMFESRPDMIAYRTSYPITAMEKRESLERGKLQLTEGARKLALRVVVEKRAKARSSAALLHALISCAPLTGPSVASRHLPVPGRILG